MKRQSSYIQLNRSLVEKYGHFPAMVLDCLKNRVEYHLDAGDADDRYFRENEGMFYVKASGRFISNWIMCDRSTAIKALAKLSEKKVIDKAYLTGKQNGAWYAFTYEFIKSSKGFFDDNWKPYLLQTTRPSKSSPVGDIPSTGDDLITTPGDDNILTGDDEILTSGDNIITSPLYNTNNTNNHLKGEGGFVDDFLSERDAPFRASIIETLADYPEPDPVAIIKQELGWKTCRRATTKQVKRLSYEFGFDIYGAAVVIAAAERDLKSPLSFIRQVCSRLNEQRKDNERRRRIVPPAPIQAPAPKSSKSVQQILGQSFKDPEINLADFR